MTHPDLTGLGWSQHFDRERGDDPLPPARLIGVERDHVMALDPAAGPDPLRLVVPREVGETGDGAENRGFTSR